MVIFSTDVINGQKKISAIRSIIFQRTCIFSEKVYFLRESTLSQTAQLSREDVDASEQTTVDNK